MACAATDVPTASAAAAARKWNERFIIASLLSPARAFHRLGLEQNLLHAPVGDLGDEEFVGVAAVDLVHGTELLQRLSGLAELAENRAVELHLVDLAGLRGRTRVAVVRHRV